MLNSNKSIKFVYFNKLTNQSKLKVKRHNSSFLRKEGNIWSFNKDW